MALDEEKIEQDILQSKIPALVEFYALWCGPCKAMRPTVSDISKKLQNKINFWRIDIEEYPKLAQRFDVLSLPTFLLYKQGVQTMCLTGIQPKRILLKFLRNKKLPSGRG